MKKLNLIQDVQLILVDKYRTATRLMMSVVVLMILSLSALAGLIVKSYDLTGRIMTLQAEQQKLVERGAQIEKKTDQTNEKVDQTNEKVDQTNEKVDQVVETAPQVEIDASGKAKVVLPFKHRTPKAAPTHSASAPLPPQLPVEAR
jgi:methyl-accepting chemotaxis protein